MNSPLCFVKEIKYARDQHCKICDLDNLSVFRPWVVCDLCNGLESSISCQIVCQSFVVDLNYFTNLVWLQITVGHWDEVSHWNDRAFLDLLVDICLLELGSDCSIDGLYHACERGFHSTCHGVSQHNCEDTCNSKCFAYYFRVFMVDALKYDILNLLVVSLIVWEVVLRALEESSENCECI